MTDQNGNKRLIDGNNDDDDEIWNTIIIDGTYSKYLVSNYGRIINSISAEFLHPTIPESETEYPYLTLRNKGHSYRFDIHDLVGTYFVYNPKPDIYNVVHHKNGDNKNFVYTNLEWTDNSGNAKYGTLIGEIKIGEDSASAKITEKTSKRNLPDDIRRI